MSDVSNSKRRRRRNEDEVQAKPIPNTTKLEASDIYLSIKSNAGLNRKDEQKSSLDILREREQRCPLSSGQKSLIGSHYLPNRMHKIARHNNRTFCSIFSKDGKYLLTTVHDKSIRLYRTRGGRYKQYQKYPASGVGWSILDIAFSPDGNHFVYSSWSESLYLQSIHGDPSHRKPLLLIGAKAPMFCIFSVVYSTDGREILCGSNDDSLYIYDQESQNCTTIKGLNRQINSVALADNSSQILYTAGDDALCKVWDRRILRTENSVPVGVLAGHISGITYIDPRGDGRHLITNSKDQTIKLWDTRVFSNKSAVEAAKISVVITNISWDYRWQHVPRKLANTWQPLEGDASIMTYRGHVVSQTLIRCHFSPAATTGQRYIYTGDANGSVIIYDALTGKIANVLKGHKFVVRDVSWHPFHQEIVSASWDGVVASWRHFNDDYYNDNSDASSRSSSSIDSDDYN